MAHQQVAQGHPEQPHGGDADHHGVAGVAGGAQDVGQGEAGRPDEQGDDVEPHHDLQREAGGLGGEVEELQHEPVAAEEGRQVHRPGAGVGQAHHQAAVALGLLFVAGAQALAQDGQRAHAHGVGRDVQQGGGIVGHRVGRNGRGAQGAGQAGHRQLADLEHPVLDGVGDADDQDAPDQAAVGPQGLDALHPQHTAGPLQQVEHRRAGDDAGDQGGQRRAEHRHAAAINKDGVAADVQHVHHQAGQHADLAVALRPEQSRPRVVHPDEGVAQSRHQEVSLGVGHHVVVDGAENGPQDQVPPKQDHQGHRAAEGQHHQHDLAGGGLGVFGLLVANVLAGDHRAAGGQGRHDLDHQGVEGVHQADARDGGLAHRGHHQGVGQADGDAEGLLCHQRQQQGDELLPGEDGPGLCSLCHKRCMLPPAGPPRCVVYYTAYYSTTLARMQDCPARNFGAGAGRFSGAGLFTPGGGYVTIGTRI